MIAIVEGDSLAVGMQASLMRRVYVESYDARINRTTAEGVARLRTKHLRNRTVFVSLGTNDLGRSAGYMANQVKAVLAMHPKCVVWGEVAANRRNGVSTINRGLRSIHSSRLVLVKPITPTGPDGVHLTPHQYRLRAARFAAAAQLC